MTNDESGASYPLMPNHERHCRVRPGQGPWLTHASVFRWRTLLILLAGVVASGAFAEDLVGDSSRLPRHPLERAALTDPERSLTLIEEALQVPEVRAVAAQVSLLQLAKANACRVMGDWHCQRLAGALAAEAGAEAADAVLEVRGLIAEARGSMSLGDMVYGEQILGRAELLLLSQPNSELTADIQLAYSSLSFRLGRAQLAITYAQRGLDVLAAGEALPMRVRLLRNLARGKLRTGDFMGVERTLREALEVPLQPPDPKLLAEIHLELARLARREGDPEGQREHGQKVLRIGSQLANTQLTGLAHEVLANLALDQGNRELAKLELGAARDHFAALDLASDELRVMPGLLRLESDPEQIATMAMRLLDLDVRVDEANRNQAAADFDLRLQHAEQELTLAQMQASAELIETRLSSARERNQLFAVILMLVLMLAATLGYVLVNQRRLNRQLQAVLESRQRALLITSHELRNPIAGVVGLAELLLRSKLASHQQEMVRALMSAADSVGKLSQDLLDRGRAESGELRLSPHAVSLRDQAVDLEQLYALQARSKGVRFSLELDSELPDAVMVDGERLHQVLTNLLSNALKFTEQGQIKLRMTALPGVSPGEAGVRFEVADSGTGMTAADQAQLFEPFSKGSQGAAHSFGAGLGLSICRDLVSLMGGRIKVESEPGVGTRMRFTLQLPLAKTATGPKKPQSDVSQRDASVLVVDDDPDLQLLYAAQLEALGCEVECVGNSQACIVRSAEKAFDLILLDDHLKRGERGSEIARSIPVVDGYRPRVVIVSGSPAPEDLPDGADEWITKPMRLDHLGRIIDGVKRARTA